MKKNKRLLMILGVSVLTLVMMTGIFFGQDSKSALANQNVSDTEFVAEYIENTEQVTGVAEIETEIETETETEVELSYIEMYGLEKVDKPKRRNAQQVLEKLAELSKEHELIKQVYENADAYSEDILKNLANNPEMAAFALGTLEADGSVTGGFTEAELEAEYPLLLQFDPRWGYYEYGGKEMGNSGCAPTSLSMVMLYLTDLERVTPDKIAAYSTEHGYYVKGVGTAWKLLDEYPVIYGLTVEHPSMKEESMKNALDQGKVLVCSMRPGEFTAAGHFIVVYGYDENGFKVNDPMCVARSNRTWTFEEFGDQLKRIWAYGA